MAIRPDDYDEPMTLEDRIDTGKAQIMRDILEGNVPADVPDFSALHDHVDANYYGNLFNEGTYGPDRLAPWLEEERFSPETEYMVNPLQDALDTFVKRMHQRSYVVGLPVAITVSDDGSVDYSVDLDEAADVWESAEGLSDEQISADVDRIVADVDAHGAWRKVSR